MQEVCAGRSGSPRRLSAIEQVELQAALDSQLRAGRTDDAGATDEEDFQMR